MLMLMLGRGCPPQTGEQLMCPRPPVEIPCLQRTCLVLLLQIGLGVGSAGLALAYVPMAEAGAGLAVVAMAWLALVVVVMVVTGEAEGLVQRVPGEVACMIHADGTQHTSAKCLVEQRSQAQRRLIAALQLLCEDCPQWSNCGGRLVV